MREPTYLEALRTAWQITKEHKFLFIFGLFAVFVGQLGVLDLVLKIGLTGSDYGTVPLWPILASLGVLGPLTFAGFSIEIWVLVVWLLTVCLGFGILFTFISVVSYGALVHATGQYANHQRKTVSLSTAWHQGVNHFWRLLGIVVFKKVSLAVLALVTSIAILNAVAYASLLDAILFIFIFVLALAVGLTISFVSIYAAGYVVIEDYPLGNAIQSAWQLFREHWLVSIEIGITVLILNLIAALLAIASLTFLFIPTLLLWMAASVNLTSSLILFHIGSLFAVGIMILLIATLGSGLMVYTTAVWMDLFQHMHKRGLTSRLMRRLRRS